jgi:hypothetical protein
MPGEDGVSLPTKHPSGSSKHEEDYRNSVEQAERRQSGQQNCPCRKKAPKTSRTWYTEKVASACEEAVSHVCQEAQKNQTGDDVL